MQDVTDQTVDRKAVMKFVRHLYGRSKWLDGASCVAHFSSVAARAEQLGLQYFKCHESYLSAAAMHQGDLLYCSGLVHEVLENKGICFEELVELIGVDSALRVASISRDLRLPRDRRRLAYLSQLSARDPITFCLLGSSMSADVDYCECRFMADTDSVREFVRENFPLYADVLILFDRFRSHPVLSIVDESLASRIHLMSALVSPRRGRSRRGIAQLRSYQQRLEGLSSKEN